MEEENEYLVHPPGMWENENSQEESTIKDWYAVSNDLGIVAYFGDEDNAYIFAELMNNK